MKLLILADDFTGACDAAAAFAASERTLVVLSVPEQWPVDAEVLGLDLDLRERTNAVAQAVTSEAARAVCSGQPQTRVFLKIDSTLRGPIAGLVAGALAGSAREVAVIAPAFPEQGRLLREARLVVDGRQGASLTDALGMDRTALLGANFARSAEEIELAVEHARMRGARHVVVDADGVDCLWRVAHAWRRHPDWLLVGSAGLARQVAGAPNRKNQVTTATNRTTLVMRAARATVLVVAGSPAPATQAQIERLRHLGPTVLVGVESPLPPRPSGQYAVLVVCTPPAAKRDSGESARAVAETVAGWATGFEHGSAARDRETAEFRPGALVLAGGDTARLVCARLGVYGIRLNGEMQPGIPQGSLQGGVWDSLGVVTKAGGFGPPAALLDVVQALGVSSIAERTRE